MRTRSVRRVSDEAKALALVEALDDREVKRGRRLLNNVQFE